MSCIRTPQHPIKHPHPVAHTCCVARARAVQHQRLWRHLDAGKRGRRQVQDQAHADPWCFGRPPELPQHCSAGRQARRRLAVRARTSCIRTPQHPIKHPHPAADTWVRRARTRSATSTIMATSGRWKTWAATRTRSSTRRSLVLQVSTWAATTLFCRETSAEATRSTCTYELH